MRRTRRLLAALTATLLAALVLAVPALAVHSASCGWRTDYVQFYSPTYNEYPIYNGHVLISGHYWRDFSDYSNWLGYGNYLHDSVVYCG